jgi:hypothetical protein
MIICCGITQDSPFGFASRTALRFLGFDMSCSLQMIENHCFAHSSLEPIAIPTSVECIGAFACFACHELRQLIFKNHTLSRWLSATFQRGILPM